MMNDAVSKLFTEHESPTHTSKDAAHADLQLVDEAVSRVRKQIAEYQPMVSAIERAPDGGGLAGVIEHLHQTLGALETEAAVMFASNRRLTKAYAQWDRYLLAARDTLEQKNTPAPANGAGAGATTNASS